MFLIESLLIQAGYNLQQKYPHHEIIQSFMEDYLDVLDLLEELSDRFSIVVYAYVLMGNHSHLLLRTNQSNLSKAMQWFGTAYTRRFNIRNKQSGHLFQGRFKSILVENDTHNDDPSPEVVFYPNSRSETGWGHISNFITYCNQTSYFS